jgi:hypothetical protein
MQDRRRHLCCTYYSMKVMQVPAMWALSGHHNLTFFSSADEDGDVNVPQIGGNLQDRRMHISQVGYIDLCVWCNFHCTMVPSILEPLVRGPPQEAAKLNTFMREPLFSLRLKIRYDDYFCNSVSNDAVITNYIGSVFCFLHAGGSHLCAYQ